MRCHGGPEVADKANLGKEASSAGMAEKARRCAVGAGVSDLACCTFLLSLKGPALLCSVGSFDDGTRRVCPRRVTPRTQY